MQNQSSKGDPEIAQLQERVTEALTKPGGHSREQLDALLTECAAVALRLRTKRVRVEREIEDVREVAASIRFAREGVADQAIAS